MHPKYIADLQLHIDLMNHFPFPVTHPDRNDDVIQLPPCTGELFNFMLHIWGSFHLRHCEPMKHGVAAMT